MKKCLQNTLVGIRSQKGFSVLEVLLASVLFVIFATAAMVAVVGGFTANRLGQETSIATQFASEGLEAIRSIRNQGFSNIDGLPASDCSTGTGVAVAGGVWTLSGSSNTLTSDSRFNRVIKICDSQRIATSSSNLSSSGTTYQNVKKVTSTVSWTFGAGHSSSVTLTTYLANWRSEKGGMLVYGDGSTTANTVKYQIYNASTDSWTVAAATATVGSTGYALRAVRVYASNTRNEKIAISRHYNGSSTQEIWAQVYNGNTGAWGNATRLSSWAATTFVDVRNFDGSYLGNGNFLVVYSDNTNIPKYAIWNGTAWTGVGTAMTSLGTSTHIPAYIVARARPGTNEVMAGFADQANATITQYYNGTSWSAITSHATNNPANTKELVDFGWIPNSLKGALIYASGNTTKTINTKVFTADGAGSGTWTSTAATGNLGTTVGAMNLDTRSYVNEYVACDKTAGNVINCFHSSSTPSFSVTTNNTIAAATETGIERSYDIAYTATSGAQAIVVYSDNTSLPKYKKLNPVTDTFDVNATSLGVTLGGTVTTVRAVAQPEGDDIMFLIFDNTRKVYTVGWDATNNRMYSSGNKSLSSTAKGSNGSAINELWANFAWDTY